jgi:uncharacterized protein
MLNQQIDYASLVEKALLRVVHDVLGMVAAHGLPGRHHLYITFRTDHPGVVMDETLRARYPNEMTIVLQHEFWGLEVSDDRFGITLSFSGLPHRLEIPIDAVSVFADPSVEFGLQFTRTAAPADQAPAPVAKLPTATQKPAKQGDLRLAPAPVSSPGQGETAAAGPGASSKGRGADKVVTLDRFRKK